MRTKLLTLVVGVAMLGSVGIAQAESGAQTDVQIKNATAQPTQARARVALTDAQMQKVTAGHYWNQTAPWNIFSGPTWHWGNFQWWDGARYQTNYGWHRG